MTERFLEDQPIHEVSKNILKLPDGFVSKIFAKDEESGFFMELQEIAPNSFFAEHQHGSDEWVYIFEGQLEDEFGEYPAGTFKLNLKGSVHTPSSKNGCKLIVVRKASYGAIEETK